MNAINIYAIVPEDKCDEASADWQRVRELWNEMKRAQEEVREAMAGLQLIRAKCLAEIGSLTAGAICDELKRFREKWNARPEAQRHSNPNARGNEVLFSLW